MADAEDIQATPPGDDPPRRPLPKRRPQSRDEDDDDDYRRPADDGGVSTLIPYKNPKALTAYYLGVFSLIPCAGALLGPAALILGILGLRYVKANPTAKGTGHAIAGVVLGSLTTLGNWGLILIGVVGALAGGFK